MYKAVMEMMPHERPDDSIIQDDVKFDRWCDQFTREQAVKLAKLHDHQAAGGLTDEQKRKAMPMFGGPSAAKPAT